MEGWKMLNFLDVYERAIKGPIMSEENFDMNVFVPKLKEVVKAYEIEYDRENPLPSDDCAADNMFNAAIDFFSQVGVYCKDTNRVMQFTKEEILEAVKVAPGRCFCGEGKDAGVFGMRRPDERKRPWIHVGMGVIPYSEEMATNLIEAYASIPEVNGICNCHLSSIRGIPVTAGSPTEIYAAIHGVRIVREGCRRAGRPGLPIMNLISGAAAAVTCIAASAPQFGLRPTDAWGAPFIPEMKVNFETMNKVAYLLNWGANIRPSSSPLLGGYCGGPAGTALVCTAYILAGLLVLKGNFYVIFPIHFVHGWSSTRDVLWAVSSSCQAASRNIPMPAEWLGMMAAGPNTKMYFHEAAAYLLCAVTSGAPCVKMCSPVKCGDPERLTPMEAKFVVEMATAASKLNREEARGIVIRLLEKYESQIEMAPLGDRYQDCYDMITGKPKEGYVRLYSEVKEELAGMGIPFE
jgi:methylamine--corrinoid protein Co-methyltransferase